jgi:large subunit ribosomal protein L29
MKVNEIRDMSPDERVRKLTELDETLFNLRFQHGTGQLENPRKIEQAKRDIARVKTVMREAELNPNPNSEA